ncbi:Uncharacterised protein [uncultured archaeon]|nr:Uncharacterised protein [uncultured archaeon]
MPPYDPDPQIIEKSLHELDYADVIALLDPIPGGTELDFNFLGEKLNDFDFLRECLRKIPETHDAIVKYSRMDQQKVRETIERLLKLTE